MARAQAVILPRDRKSASQAAFRKQLLNKSMDQANRFYVPLIHNKLIITPQFTVVKTILRTFTYGLVVQINIVCMLGFCKVKVKLHLATFATDNS